MSSANHEAETSGPSNRIGLSGANRTMLHLLKKAKVQLIKIDQQKQLKLSLVRIFNQVFVALDVSVFIYAVYFRVNVLYPSRKRN